MEIYIARTDCLENKDLFQKLFARMPIERQKKITDCSHAKDQYRSLGAGVLLEYGLNMQGLTMMEKGEYRQIELSVGEQGKPYIRDRTLAFNLSHSGDFVAAVFAKEQAGIDIEQYRTGKQKLAKRFFMEKEYEYLMSHQEERRQNEIFTELWTRKESYIKAAGAGMKIPMNSFCVLEDEMNEPETFYFHTWNRCGEYVVSVCTRQKETAEPQMLRLDNI